MPVGRGHRFLAGRGGRCLRGGKLPCEVQRGLKGSPLCGNKGSWTLTLPLASVHVQVVPGWGGGRSGPSGPPHLLSRQMKGALTEIIQLATLDSDPWVLMVADILKSFPDTGSLNLDLEEQNPNVQDILGELREKGTCGPTVPEGQTASLQTPLANELASRVSLWFCRVTCAPSHPGPRAAVHLFARLRDKAPSSLHLFFLKCVISTFTSLPAQPQGHALCLELQNLEHSGGYRADAQKRGLKMAVLTCLGHGPTPVRKHLLCLSERRAEEARCSRAAVLVWSWGRRP